MTTNSVISDSDPSAPKFKQPSRNPREISHQSVEIWLKHIAAEYPVALSFSLKRTRSTTPSPLPDHQSQLQRSPKTLLEGDMDQSQSESVGSTTPSKGASSSEVSNQNPTTPSHIIHNYMKINIPQDAAWVKGRLRTYRCYQNEQGALEKYPTFRNQILGIINGKRLSAMSVGSARKFSKKLSQNAVDNEDTFLHNVLPTIIKESRVIKSRVPDKAPRCQKVVEALEQLQSDTEVGVEVDFQQQSCCEIQDTGNYEYERQMDRQSRASGPEIGQAFVEEFESVVEEFAESGVAVKVNRELRGHFLPHPLNTLKEPDTELNKAMAKVNGMKNAKPDRVYGIQIDKYPVPYNVNISVLLNLLLEIVPLLHWPFFIIEGKSDSGSMDEAANQACRGGASIINASQGLLKAIGEPTVSESGPDSRSFMFSATVSPTVMEIWVHWAEYREKEHALFHMHRLRAFALNDVDAAPKLRKIIHNILDWGCGERFEGIKKIYDKIFDYERRRATKDMYDNDEGNTGSPTKRQKTKKEYSELDFRAEATVNDVAITSTYLWLETSLT